MSVPEDTRGKYRTIVADPPWEIGDFPEWGEGSGTVKCPYPTMSVDEIARLPVGQLALNRDMDAHLYLWTTTEFLWDAGMIVEDWGFRLSAVLVWCKPPRGVRMGGLFASNVEFILFCRKPKYVSVDQREPRPDIAALTSEIRARVHAEGFTTKDVNAWVGASDIASWWLTDLPLRCAVPKPEHWAVLVEKVPSLDELSEMVAKHNAAKGTERKPPSALENPIDTRWFVWPRGKHSEKPEAFLDMVERVSPAPRLEMFARRNRLGWDTWGNEALGHVELAS